MANYTIDIEAKVQLRVTNITADDYDSALEQAKDLAKVDLNAYEWVDSDYDEYDPEIMYGTYDADSDRDNLIDYLQSTVNITGWEKEEAMEAWGNKERMPDSLIERVEDEIEVWCKEIMRISPEDVFSEEDTEVLLEEIL